MGNITKTKATNKTSTNKLAASLTQDIPHQPEKVKNIEKKNFVGAIKDLEYTS